MKRKKRLRSKIFVSFLLSITILAQGALSQSLPLAMADTGTGTSASAPASNPSLDVINQKLETVAQEKGIPSVILKAVAFKESSWRQFDSQGNSLLAGPATHPAIGIMQIASYDGTDQATIAKLKSDIDFNIETGADLLNQKWKMVPKIGDGDRNVLENWYFAIWAYNCWDGRNNPNVVSSESAAASSSASAATSAGSSSNAASTSDTNSTSASSAVSNSTTNTDLNLSSGSTTNTDSAPGSGSSSGSSSGSGSSTPAPTMAYQDKVLKLIAQPPSPLNKYIQALAITPIPAANLPQTGIPASSSTWITPSPEHTGDLGTTDSSPDSNSNSGSSSNSGGTVVKYTSVIRVAGTDSIDTAIRQAQLGWPQGAGSVVLARSDDFPDALAGVPLAAQLDAPILLTPSQGLDSRVQGVLKTLHPQKIYLLGGEGALSAKVSSDLSNLGWSSANQVRLGGLNRYATAAVIAQTLAQNLNQNQNSSQQSALVITTGENFPDALSISSIAGQKKMKILLTQEDQLPQETLASLQQIKPSQIYLVGGEGVISESVVQQISTALHLPASAVTRLAGANRYDTMAAVGTAFEGDIQSLCFATGEDFPNALTGAAVAAHEHQTLILVPKAAPDQFPGLQELIMRHLPQTAAQPYLFGDTVAVPQDIEDNLNRIMNGKN